MTDKGFTPEKDKKAMRNELARLERENKRLKLIDCDQASVSDRIGKGSAHYIYDPIVTGLSASLGDCSLKEAMRKGHFGRVGTADYEFLSILGIYSKTTVHAYQSTQLE